MSTSFVNTVYAAQQPTNVRASREAAPFSLRIDATRATATLLLAAIVAALLVVANQVIDTWTEGHLLAAWVLMWTIAFAGLALLASPARRAAKALRATASEWKARRVQARHDEQFWQAALSDARIMADISRAMSASALQDSRAAATYF
jgi:hypothetical protein